MEPHVFFPVKRVFVLRPVLWTAFGAFVVALIAAVLIGVNLSPLAALGAPLLAILLIAYVAVDRTVAFSKTRYELHPERLVHKTGGLFSDNTTNLPYRNVTQLALTLPFLEHKFFQTGHIDIHAAGCASGKVSLTSIADSEAVYARLEQALGENGFALSRDHLVQREEPGTIGVVLDTLAGHGPVSFFFALFGFISLAGVLVEFSDGHPLVAVLLLGLVLVALPLIIVRTVLTLIDLKRRVYILWENLIEYEDGFLTRRRKLIPIANLADTNVNEQFFKRIFGLADVVVSCQGSAGNINFPSMPRFKEFCANLDRLIEATDQPTGPAALLPTAPTAPTAPGDPTAVPLATDGTVSPAVPVATPQLGRSAEPRTYKIHFLRFFIPGIVASLITSVLVTAPALFVLGPLALLIFVGVAVSGVIFTAASAGFLWLTEQMTFGARSVSWTKEVIANKQSLEYTNDKITKIVVRRSLIDRYMDTTTVLFHSIGAASALKFRCLKGFDDVFGELAKRFELPSGESADPVVPTVSASAALLDRASMFTGLLVTIGSIAIIPALILESILPFLAIVAATFLLCAAILAYDLAHAERCRLHFFEHYAMVRKGLFNFEYTYIPFHQARNIISVQYPGHTTGRIIIDAGGAGARAEIRHIDNPTAVHDRLDAVLYQRPMKHVAQTATFDSDVLAQWQPVANYAIVVNLCWIVITIASLMIAAITLGPLAIFGLVVLSALTIALVIYLIKLYYQRASCTLQQDRICQRRGIFYKRFSTVLINRIDQIQTRRDFLHNLLKVGIVQIFTVGSGEAELTLGPHPQFQEIYETIDKRATSR